MKGLQLLAMSAVFVYIVISAAQHYNPPLWLVSVVIIGPFWVWLFAPLILRRPHHYRDTGKCAPSLLDLLLDR